jgi:hypothetical protein
MIDVEIPITTVRRPAQIHSKIKVQIIGRLFQSVFLSANCTLVRD